MSALPFYGKYIDDLVKDYERVFILGDVHNNQEGLLKFLKFQELIHPDITKLSLVNSFLKNVLILFLGDVIGKIYKDSTEDYLEALSVLEFIAAHKKNCFLIIGNHEIKFLTRNVVLDGISNMALTKMIIPKCSENANRVVSTHMNLEKFMWRRNNKRPDDKNLRKKIKSEYNQFVWLRFCMIFYIVHFGEFIVYYQRYKIFMFHAGLDFSKTIKRQHSSVLCNMRTSRYKKNKKIQCAEKCWYKRSEGGKKKYYFDYKDATFVFGHDSDLCVVTNDDDEKILNYKPFVYRDSNNNHFICLDTNFYKSNVLSYIIINPSVNPFNSYKNVTSNELFNQTLHEFDLFPKRKKKKPANLL